MGRRTVSKVGGSQIKTDCVNTIINMPLNYSPRQTLGECDYVFTVNHDVAEPEDHMQSLMAFERDNIGVKPSVEHRHEELEPGRKPVMYEFFSGYATMSKEFESAGWKVHSIDLHALEPHKFTRIMP